MSTKNDYSPDEWQIIVKAAPMAGLAVTLASPNGPLGVMKEMFAVGMALADTLQTGSPHELVRSLIDDLKARGTQPERPTGMDSPDQLREACLQAMRDLDGVLARKATADEALGFKQWLHGVAQRVAEASNEGGFLGLGGEKVSQAERDALQALSRALRLS